MVLPDINRYHNEDLELHVSTSVNPSVFNMDKYEPFIDLLCENREYQKEAIRIVLRFLLGEQYKDLEELARENYQSNERLRKRYKSFSTLQSNLHFADRLSCAVDLATGTGKSYVIYAIARIMLACGAVDQVLVLCPSLTIEAGLLKKFKALEARTDLTDVMPDDSVWANPESKAATVSIVKGIICVENFQATLEATTSSSIRASLSGKGARTLVLNDEAHHVYTPPNNKLKKWQTFLLDPEFGFRYIVGFSGTCYIRNEYFNDVVYRYSLREALEEKRVKDIDYIEGNGPKSQTQRFQEIYANHQTNRNKYRRVKPLTILITSDITVCINLQKDLVAFLAEQENIPYEEAEKKVLIVTSKSEHRPNVDKLQYVDVNTNPVEWITSVSMLTEGWDVQNVLQIVPEEERAFNSKLLIAQVLGRGLRVPDEYRGDPPVLTVFNHNAWSSRIRQLLDEVVDVERRVASYPIAKDEDYNFVLHNVQFGQAMTDKPMPNTHEFEFNKDSIDLLPQKRETQADTIYVRATTRVQQKRRLTVHQKLIPLEEVAQRLHEKFVRTDDNRHGATQYAKKYNLEWIRQLLRSSIRAEWDTPELISEDNEQLVYGAFEGLSPFVPREAVWQTNSKQLVTLSTAALPRETIAVSALRRAASIFYDRITTTRSDENTRELIRELERDKASLPSLALNALVNSFMFKTPQNLVIADHKPEWDFVQRLIDQDNVALLTAWIKSTRQGFYSIKYAWYRGDYKKRGEFNPDFFIKIGKHILIIEIKDNKEATDPSPENIGKYKAGKEHVALLNTLQTELTYHFNMLIPDDFATFFALLQQADYTERWKLELEIEGSREYNL